MLQKKRPGVTPGKITAIFLLSCLILSLANLPVYAGDDKKVVVIVMDYIDTSDLVEANTPNLDKLAAISGTGLMNIRAKNRHPSSSYMSLSTGYRVGSLAKSEMSYNTYEAVNEIPPLFTVSSGNIKAGDLYTAFTGTVPPSDSIVNVFGQPLKKHASSYNPPYTSGNIGQLADNFGINIAVLGNADTYNEIDRSIALLAMNEHGIVKHGTVSKEILEYDPHIPGAYRTEHQAFIERFRDLLKQNDILFLELGDTSRIEKNSFNTAEHIQKLQRQKAIERDDLLLGKVINNLDMDKTMINIITPNPNAEMILADNFGLTPVVLYVPEKTQGFLTSSTTRRTGLVSNADFLPTIFSFLGFDVESSSSGMKITASTDNSFQDLDEQLNTHKQVRANRPFLHYLFIIFSLLTVAAGYLLFIRQKKRLTSYLKPLVLVTLSMPLVFLFTSYTGYVSIPVTISITLLAALVIGILLSIIFKNPLHALMLLTGITAAIIVVDCFSGSHLMLVSPLGSDTIAGGRFYGIGNDYMGILIASTVISAVLFARQLTDKPKLQTLLTLVPILLICVAIGHPHYGANVGGLLTAVVTLAVLSLIITDKRFHLKQLVFIGVIAISAVILMAQLDAMISSNPSHAGQAITQLTEGGLLVFFNIIRTKLGILASTVYHSPWSLVLLFMVSVLAVIKKNFPHKLIQVSAEQQALSKIIRILSISSITVFLVNDTGVIAAALILLYAISSLWIALYQTEDYQQ